MNESEITNRMEQSLRMATDAWRRARMPEVNPNDCKDQSRPAIAALAVRIFDELTKPND